MTGDPVGAADAAVAANSSPPTIAARSLTERKVTGVRARGKPIGSETRQPDDGCCGTVMAFQQEPPMPSIRREISLSASPNAVWDVVRDVGAVHTRFAPGFVTDTVLEDGARVVTFANGLVAREIIVDLDDAARRLAYSVRSERLTHHNASFQVFPEGAGSRLVWVADVLPREAATTVEAMMNDGIAAAGAALNNL
jgi:carbon monoxide dehydrogenase subunit G